MNPIQQQQVKLNKRTVVFPPVCPHCMESATTNIAVRSEEQLAGYFVFFTRWKHSVIQVPFCASFAKRLSKVYIICHTTAFCLLTAYIILTIATLRAVEGFEAGLVFLVFIGIFWIPPLIVRPGKYIRLLNSPDGLIRFEIQNPRYAKMLMSLNGETPPENPNAGKDKDDSQSFAT